MTTFTAASIIPAFDLLAEQFDKTIQETSYLVSFQVSIEFSGEYS